MNAAQQILWGLAGIGVAVIAVTLVYLVTYRVIDWKRGPRR